MARQELIDAGLIRTWIRADTASASAWSLSRQDVPEIFRLNRRRRAANMNGTSWVCLKHVMQTRRLRTGEFPAILKACLQLDLSCWMSADAGSTVGAI